MTELPGVECDLTIREGKAPGLTKEDGHSYFPVSGT